MTISQELSMLALAVHFRTPRSVLPMRTFFGFIYACISVELILGLDPEAVSYHSGEQIVTAATARFHFLCALASCDDVDFPLEFS